MDNLDVMHDATRYALALATQDKHAAVGRDSRIWGVQCQSQTHAGARCKRFAATGCYVCKKHGAQIPVVREAGRARLSRLSLLAVLTLEDLLSLSSESDASTRLATAKYIMKISGFSSNKGRRTHRSEDKALNPGPEIGELVQNGEEVDEELELLLQKLKKA